MGPGDILLFSIIGIIVYSTISFYIIKSASKSQSIERQIGIQTRHMKVQSLLLAKMAQKAGIATDEINEILKTDSKRVHFEMADLKKE